jgi:hypothetical protein
MAFLGLEADELIQVLFKERVFLSAVWNLHVMLIGFM